MEAGMEQAATPSPPRNGSAAGGGVSRLARVALVAAAGTLAMVMVGSVLALLTDTITLAGGYVATNDWTSTPQSTPTAEPVLDLRIKVGECVATDDLSAYSDDAMISLGNFEIDLVPVANAGSGASEPVTVGTFCLRNESAYDGRLVTTVTSATSLEVGTCSADEATVDATCMDGDQGELDQFTWLAASCLGPVLTSPGSFLRLTDVGEPEVLHDLHSGETCQLEIMTGTFGFDSTSFGSPNESLLRSLTDSVSFDLAIDLQEF